MNPGRRERALQKLENAAKGQGSGPVIELPGVPVQYAKGLIGVPESAYTRALNRIKGLRAGKDPAIRTVELFGSRTGSNFRGRGPKPDSDLDMVITIRPDILSSKHGPKIREKLVNIANDFEAEAGFPLNIDLADNISFWKSNLPGAEFIRVY